MGECEGRCVCVTEESLGDGASSGLGSVLNAGRAGAGQQGGVSRRGLLIGSAGAVAVVAIAGCSSDDAPDDGSSATPTASSSASASVGTALVATDEIPVGGGKVVTGSAGVYVVTHPDDEQFLVFSGKCTHQGNTVSEVKENEIHCNWHGSVFDAATGQVLGGPAKTALPAVPSRIEGGQVLLA